MRILVVEDDAPLAEAVATVLREEGYQTEIADNGEEGLFLAAQCIHDLIILDVMLPGMSGLELLRNLRSGGSSLPVLLLTARDSVSDRVRGLDVGADDYVVKPFSMDELLARVRALLRRKWEAGNGELLCFGELALNVRQKEAFIRDQLLRLSAKEYELLEFLILHKEHLLTREQIFDRIWGIDSDAGTGIIDLYVHYVRKKLAASDYGHVIHTVRGVGYMLSQRRNES